jgi:phosphomannomutase
MINFLKELTTHFDIAAVGGSDLIKLKEQLGSSFDIFTYVFTENGLVAFKKGERFHERVYFYFYNNFIFFIL